MMDTWKYLSEQSVFISGESDFPFHGVGVGNGSCNKNNKVVMGNEMKPMYSFENYPPFVSNARAFDRLDLMEMEFSDEIRKSSYSDEPSGEVFSTGTGTGTGTDSSGNVVVSSFCDQEKDSGRRGLVDYVQSKNWDWSVVDGNVPGSSDVMSDSVNRARSGTSLYHRSSCCQVFGCKKDLSLYKGYYKRHKVCDVHTKTAKVVIEGIEQRFCQQCSRFHLLAEFDDGKRSCRRRLAAHNKRRRKPQHASKSGEGKGNVANYGMKDNILDLKSSSNIQQTSSALSLLSAQSHNMLTQLQGAAITSPLVNRSNQTNTEKMTQNGFHKPGMYLVGANNAKDTIINHCADANSIVDLEFQDDGISVGPYLRNNNYNNIDYHNNPVGRGIILDLFQLSSHLQRIEHQKHSTESEVG